MPSSQLLATQVRLETVPVTGQLGHSRLNQLLSSNSVALCFFSIILSSYPCISACHPRLVSLYFSLPAANDNSNHC